MLTIPIIKEAVNEIAPHFSISRVDLFGSYATGQATEASDIDVLIDKSASFSLFDMCRFSALLESKLGLNVDVVIDTPHIADSPLMKKRVVLYER